MNDGTETIVNYIEGYIPSWVCNLRCDYCYVPKARGFSDKPVNFRYEPGYMAKALSKERLGGTSLISICCDGEPLLSEEMLDFMESLLDEGHYLYVITNGTPRRAFERLNCLPKSYLQRILMKFSVHYFELKKKNLLDIFFTNIMDFRKAGGNITLAMVGSRDYLENIDEIKSLCMEYVGALPQIDIARDETDKITEFFPKEEASSAIWDTFDSVYWKTRNQFTGKICGSCLAGKKAFHLNLLTGDIYRCSRTERMGNIYQDINTPIRRYEEGKECPLNYCMCGVTFLAYGVMPDYKGLPTFYELFNRIDRNGEPWISDAAKTFFNERFYGDE